MTLAKGFGIILATLGVMILLYSLSFESKFDVPKGGIFIGIITALLGIILYMFSKKSNGMIRAR